MKTTATLALIAVSLATLGFAVAGLGLIDVAASSPHAAFVEDLIHGAMRRSVERRATRPVPPDLADAVRVERGLEHYREMCADCHGAPEEPRSELAQGLYPQPPQFAEGLGDWSDAELHWITEHGLKLTGMPGFGATHEAEALWDLVAVLRLLPEMEAETYRGERKPSGHAHDHDHDQHQEKKHD